MRKLAKVSAMILIAVIMQIGANELAFEQRGYKATGGEVLIFPTVLFIEYKAFCSERESFVEEDEEEYNA